MHGRVAVKLISAATVTAGGIHIPEQYAGAPTQGTVYAIKESDRDEYGLDVGDIVLFGPHTGTRVSIGRDTVIVLRIIDISSTVIEVDDSTADSTPTTLEPGTIIPAKGY